MPLDRPRLLAFLPCERVILGGEADGTASVIAILQGFNLHQKIELQSPKAPSAVMPLRWWLFSLWENDYSGRSHTVKYELRSPRKTLSKVEGPLALHPTKRFQRLTTVFNGFPIDGDGDYTAHLFLKLEGETKFDEMANFPIPFTYALRPDAEKPSSSKKRKA